MVNACSIHHQTHLLSQIQQTHQTYQIYHKIKHASSPTVLPALTKPIVLGVIMVPH